MTARSSTANKCRTKPATQAHCPTTKGYEHAASLLNADDQAWGDIPHTPWATAQACVNADDTCAQPLAPKRHPAIDQAEEDLRFPAAAYVALWAALVGSALAAAWWPWGFAPAP